MKDEALNTFLVSVKTGNSIRDCIAAVQDEVLPKVPKRKEQVPHQVYLRQSVGGDYHARHERLANCQFEDRDWSQQIQEWKCSILSQDWSCSKGSNWSV